MGFARRVALLFMISREMSGGVVDGTKILLSL